MDQRVRRHFQDSIATSYPTYDAWRRSLGRVDIDKMQEDAFTFGRERLLDGLESWLSRAR